MERWTIKQLKEISMKTFIQAILSERQAKLNPYCPLSVKLSDAKKFLDKNIKDET